MVDMHTYIHHTWLIGGDTDDMGDMGSLGLA